MYEGPKKLIFVFQDGLDSKSKPAFQFSSSAMEFGIFRNNYSGGQLYKVLSRFSKLTKSLVATEMNV